jgi:hypothetical protein
VPHLELRLLVHRHLPLQSLHGLGALHLQQQRGQPLLAQPRTHRIALRRHARQLPPPQQPHRTWKEGFKGSSQGLSRALVWTVHPKRRLASQLPQQEHRARDRFGKAGDSTATLNPLVAPSWAWFDSVSGERLLMWFDSVSGERLLMAHLARRRRQLLLLLRVLLLRNQIILLDCFFCRLRRRAELRHQLPPVVARAYGRRGGYIG